MDVDTLSRQDLSYVKELFAVEGDSNTSSRVRSDH